MKIKVINVMPFLIMLIVTPFYNILDSILLVDVFGCGDTTGKKNVGEVNKGTVLRSDPFMESVFNRQHSKDVYVELMKKQKRGTRSKDIRDADIIWRWI